MQRVNDHVEAANARCNDHRLGKTTGTSQKDLRLIRRETHRNELIGTMHENVPDIGQRLAEFRTGENRIGRPGDSRVSGIRRSDLVTSNRGSIFGMQNRGPVIEHVSRNGIRRW